MNEKTVSMRNASTQLSRLIARVARGGLLLIARVGKPAAELQPARKVKKRSGLFDDPLLRVEEYSYDGPFGSAANKDIDRTIYGP